MSSVDQVFAGTVPAPWWNASTFSVALDPWATDAPAGVLLVGLGDARADTAGASINNKGDSGFASVSAMVAGADAAQWQRWRERFPDIGAVTKIVLEDFSLDTCLALLLFERGLRHDTLDDSSTVAWVEYVTAWETGQYLDGKDLGQSPACLVTVLGHAYLPEAVREQSEAGFVAEGLRACLRLLAALMRQRPLPQGPAIPGLGLGPEGERAQSHLVHERQLYELMLERAVRCQLLLDLDGSPRQVVADALFVSEAMPSGVLKIMARTDSEHPWCRQGHTLLGIYRPRERGTGNDMVISVDPASSVSLRGLWSELERLENECWGGARPSDQPRRLTSYLDPADPDVVMPGAPNQPWYDTNGSYTLLAAPKNVAPGTAGSRLDWCKDVAPAIWQLHFTRHVQNFVRAEAPPPDAPGRKRIRVVTRQSQDSLATGMDANQAILETPTYQAWLASHSYGAAPAASPFELPPAGSYEPLALGRHLALVHRHGLTLQLREDEDGAAGLLETAQRVADLCHEYQGFLDEYRSTLEQWQAALAGHGGKKPRNADQWAHDIHAVKVKALKVLSNTSVLRSDYDENRLSEALQRLWGLSEQRGELAASLQGIDELMQHALHMATARRQRWYGSILSALGLGLLASHVWEPVKQYLTMNPFEWQLLMMKVTPSPPLAELQRIAHEAAHYEGVTIAVVAGFSVLGFLLYWVFGLRGESH